MNVFRNCQHLGIGARRIERLKLAAGSEIRFLGLAMFDSVSEDEAEHF